MQNEITELRTQVRTIKRIVCLVCCLLVAGVFVSAKSTQTKESYGYWEYSEYDISFDDSLYPSAIRMPGEGLSVSCDSYGTVRISLPKRNTTWSAYIKEKADQAWWEIDGSSIFQDLTFKSLYPEQSLAPPDAWSGARIQTIEREVFEIVCNAGWEVFQVDEYIAKKRDGGIYSLGQEVKRFHMRRRLSND